MVNSNKSKEISKPYQCKNKHKTGGAPYKRPVDGKETTSAKPKQYQQNVNKNKSSSDRGKGDGVTQFKKPSRGKAGFAHSKEAQKHERANKFQERQAVRAQKQKDLEEERAKAKQEKEERIRQYKKKRLEKTKALSKKTHRGQPLMKDRMQLLLKQIEEMKKNG